MTKYAKYTIPETQKGQKLTGIRCYPQFVNNHFYPIFATHYINIRRICQLFNKSGTKQQFY